MKIYLITNKINGKLYVGQTHFTLEKRFQRHCWKSAHVVMPIANAIKKYGKENFTIEELCQCSTQKELDNMEIYWANKLSTFCPNGYNLKVGRASGITSEETKEKISLANKGRKFSDEHIENLSKSHMGWKPTNETKQKWRNCFQGKKQKPEHIKKRIDGLKRVYHLLSPDNIKIKIKNMKQFCIDNNLSPSKMSEVINERKLHHKKWKLDKQIKK